MVQKAPHGQLHGVTLVSIKVDCMQLHKGIVRSKCHNSDNFPSSFTAHNMANRRLYCPTKKILQSPDTLERLINAVVTMLHTESSLPCTSSKTCPQLSPRNNE